MDDGADKVVTIPDDGYAKPRGEPAVMEALGVNPPTPGKRVVVTLKSVEAEVLKGFLDPRVVVQEFERQGITLGRVVEKLWLICEDEHSRKIDRQRALEVLLKMVWKAGEAGGLVTCGDLENLGRMPRVVVRARKNPLPVGVVAATPALMDGAGVFEQIFAQHEGEIKEPESDLDGPE